MGKLKVAILEDSPILLKSLEVDLEETQLVEVVVRATNSTEFLGKVNSSPPEALILDIDLGGDSMNGIDIANKLKLPVLFVSGKTTEFNRGIEFLDMDTTNPVLRITKPFTSGMLKNMLLKLISAINATNKSQFVLLDFKDSKRNKIAIDTIVFIETETGNSGASNNKRIYFTYRKPETVIDFSFSKMEENGFDKCKFIITHKSFRLNIDKYLNYNKDHTISVEVMNENGKLEIKKIPISENYRKSILQMKI